MTDRIFHRGSDTIHSTMQIARQKIAGLLKPEQRKFRACTLEQLESRQLAAIDVTRLDDVLRITGTETNDAIVVRQIGEGAGSTVVVESRGTDTAVERQVLDLKDIARLKLFGLGGDDFLQVPGLFNSTGETIAIEIVSGEGADSVLTGDLFNVSDFAQANDQFFALESTTAEQYNARVKIELMKFFRDEYGFVVTHEGSKAGDLGEATYFTAVTATAVAADSFHLSSPTERDQANVDLEQLLSTLINHGWSLPDELGRSYPIRHPLDIVFMNASELPAQHQARSGLLEQMLLAKGMSHSEDFSAFRQSPLARDAFGQILTACLYSYTSPNTNAQVKQLARDLLAKFADFLVLNQWRLDPEVQTYTTYDASGKPKQAQPEAYFLLPNERYALQNVGAKLGLVTAQWNIWQGIGASMVQEVADIVASLAGRGLDQILQSANVSLPYDITIGPSRWGLPHIKGSFDVSISEEKRAIAVQVFETSIREGIRASALGQFQASEILGQAINRVLDKLPDQLGTDEWRSTLTSAIAQVLPWVTGEGLLEAGTFILGIQTNRSTEDNALPVIGYSVWTVIAEMETRPEMADLLRPFVREYYYNFLRPAGNDHALWAWLASDPGRVSEHLNRFVQADPRRWDDYAWHRQVNKFYAREDATLADKQSARLDYIILKSLQEKGTPGGLREVAHDWQERLVESVKSAMDRFVDNIKSRWDALHNDLIAFASALKNEIGIGINQIATILWDVQHDLTQVAEALYKGVNNDLGAVTTALAGTTTDIGRIALALKHGTLASYQTIAQKLMSSVPGISHVQVVSALSAAGADLPQIFAAMNKGLGRSVGNIARDIRIALASSFTNIAKGLMNSGIVGITTAQIASALDTAGAKLPDIAFALNRGINRSISGIAADLKSGLGSSFTDIAAAIWTSNIGGFDSSTVAAALHSANAQLHQIAFALNKGISRSINGIAVDIRKGLGSSFTNIASGLWNSGIGGFNSTHIAAALQGAGAGLPSVAYALSKGIQRSLGGVAYDLRYGLSASFTNIASGLWNSGIGGFNSTDVAAALQGAGAGLPSIAYALSKGIQRSLGGVAYDLRYGLGASFTNIASGLWNSGIGGFDSADLAAALRGAGASLSSVAFALRHGISRSLNGIAYDIRDGIGSSFTSIASGIWNSGIGGFNATDLARALRSAGAGFDSMVSALTSAVSLGYWDAYWIVRRL